MSQVIVGTIHGRTIELEYDPGLEAGRRVEGTLRTAALPGPPPGWTPQGLPSAAGLLANSWTDEDDRILADIQRQRGQSSRAEVPD